MKKNTTTRSVVAEKLRSELASIVARYDSGAVSPAIYAVIRAIESDIAWLEFRRD
ncbi:MAG: hypothetical protein ACLPTZ_07425 [Beijerinckiaceae bacterium]|jgi:hypothetical protein